ncbi:Xanthoxin dehydrogenase, partial [Gracilaria domingensis]
VTGSAGVLGQATVRMLLEEGFRVVIHDSDEHALAELLTALGPLVNGAQCYPICFDPCNSDSIEKAMDRITSDFHPVYVLVNNNGILARTPIAQTNLEAWQKCFSQNVDSAFLISRALLPNMRKRKWGRIVNTCSIAGKTGGHTTGIAYSTTKGALQTFTFALA